jgi:hypothetical protein
LCRLNVKYWREMLARRERRSNVAQVIVVTVGVLASIVAKLWSYSWLQSALPVLAGLVVTMGTRFMLGPTVARYRRYFERWCELGHDAEDLWQEGECHRWAGAQVSRKLERLTERERNYRSQEYDRPDLRLLKRCEQELWAEIGHPYD